MLEQPEGGYNWVNHNLNLFNDTRARTTTHTHTHVLHVNYKQFPCCTLDSHYVPRTILFHERVLGQRGFLPLAQFKTTSCISTHWSCSTQMTSLFNPVLTCCHSGVSKCSQHALGKKRPLLQHAPVSACVCVGGCVFVLAVICSAFSNHCG